MTEFKFIISSWAIVPATCRCLAGQGKWPTSSHLHLIICFQLVFYCHGHLWHRNKDWSMFDFPQFGKARSGRWGNTRVEHWRGIVTHVQAYRANVSKWLLLCIEMSTFLLKMTSNILLVIKMTLYWNYIILLAFNFDSLLFQIFVFVLNVLNRLL